jgi:hypothetical protein
MPYIAQKKVVEEQGIGIGLYNCSEIAANNPTDVKKGLRDLRKPFFTEEFGCGGTHP